MINPDFVMLAQAMGVHAIRCLKAEDLPAKMKEFLEHDGDRPVLMECVVTKNEHVFPMVGSFWFLPADRSNSLFDKVAAGKALHEQMLHPMLKIKS